MRLVLWICALSIIGLAACDTLPSSSTLPTVATGASTATLRPIGTPTPTATPTPPLPSELTTDDLYRGRWGQYDFIKNPEGYYEAADSAGTVIPAIRFFDDGTAQLAYRANNSIYDLTVAFQAISVEKGGLVAGLWDYSDGKWSMETYAAPKSEDDTASWRSLVVMRGHEREKALIDTIFVAGDLALRKTDAYDPEDEFRDLPAVTVNFRTIENFDLRPRKWMVHRSGYADGKLMAGWVGGHYFEPISRSSEVVYSDFSTRSYLRPMQVALGSGWFNITIYEKDGATQPTITHVPTVALNADGTLVRLSTIIRQKDLPSITGILSKEERGQLAFRLNSITVKSDRYLADQQLLGFAVQVNQRYFDEPSHQLRQVPSSIGYGWYSIAFSRLPPELGTSFWLFSSTIR